MRTLKISLAFSTVLILLISCSTIPLYVPPDVPDEELSLVYFYRESKFAGSLATPKIYMNDEYMGPLANGTYVLAKVTPGTYRLLIGKKEGDYANWGGKNVESSLTLLKGKTYYFKWVSNNKDLSVVVIPMPIAPVAYATGESDIVLVGVEESLAVKEMEVLENALLRKNR